MAKMFSKFLHGKDPDTLAAMKLQWDMEFAKANRKVLQSKNQKKKKGRPPLGQLYLNTLNGDGKTVDITNIARKVATTREGRRLHGKATEKKQENDSSKPVCFLLLACCVLPTYFFVFFYVIFSFFVV